MKRKQASAPFERVLDQVERKYLNFDGSGRQQPEYDLEYDYAEGDDYELAYDYADGAPSAAPKMKLYQADPYQIVVENTTVDPLTAILFGNDKYLLKPLFGNPVGIVLTVGQPGVEYVELLQESSTKPFSTQFLRIESDNELQVSKFLTIHKKGANGNWFRRNVNMQQFKSAYQQDRKMLDVPIEEEVNGSTYWEIEIEPRTRVFFTIFPLYKVDTSGTLGGNQPIKTFAPAQVNTHGLSIPGTPMFPTRTIGGIRPVAPPRIRPRLSR